MASEPILGQIQAFAFNFAPRGWAQCNGQLLPIAKYSALFSLLGTQYGGDGRTTFGLPDLRGRTGIHYGRGPGLSERRIGQRFGSETVTLTTGQIPSHTHGVACGSAPGDSKAPTNQFPAVSADADYGSKGDGAMNPAVVRNTGGGQAHNNLQPSLCINYCIALVGTFPSRS